MKIERFITEPSDSFDRYVELKPDPDGTLCLSSDVEKLEAEHAELKAINAQLLEALEKIAALDYTMGSINCFCWRAHTIADAAIAKAKGEMP